MGHLTWLNPHTLEFPPADMALDDPNGLLALGGDLSPQRLIRAYRLGIFPWYQDGQPLLWWCPNPRTVLFPDKLHISRSMNKFLRHTTFSVSYDRCFDQVLRQCAAPRPYSEGTWITDEMQQAYRQLHRMGIAHSVEVWDQGELVGGLYGLALGQVFFGESMFSLRSNASKTGFIHLTNELQRAGFALIDCQMPTDHLFSLGAESIERSDFLQLLRQFCPENADNHWPWTGGL
ncbi:leucyl/phenylalanyl-tRNA--protein transferase [Pseudomonas sp. WN033]|nr:leucyl/phenylalanyl-tRNA--protein transferase [Pseudomonas sp. WN033]